MERYVGKRTANSDEPDPVLFWCILMGIVLFFSIGCALAALADIKTYNFIAEDPAETIATVSIKTSKANVRSRKLEYYFGGSLYVTNLRNSTNYWDKQRIKIIICRKDPSIYILKPYSTPYLTIITSIVGGTLFILAYKYRRWGIKSIKGKLRY